MSHSPTAQLPQGTGSGRLTMPATKSPTLRLRAGPGSKTRPSDSCPNTSRSLPGAAQPYLPSAISASVPQTPTAIASTRTDPSSILGSASSDTLMLSAFNGSTVIAFIGGSLTLDLQIKKSSRDVSIGSQ